MKAVGISTLVLLALAACADFPPQRCPPGLMRTLDAELWFGRNIEGHSEVADADWQRFMDEEISPRFPAGFSVADAAGRWRNGSGAIVAERSKKITVVLSGAADEETKLSAIRDAYKRRFSQESVLIVETSVCAGF